MSGTVPLIDLTGFEAGGAARARIGEAVDKACRELGFLMITGHGLDPTVLSDCSDAAHRFFAQSDTDSPRTTPTRCR